MQEKYIEKLEFLEILNQLSNYCITNRGKEFCFELRPSSCEENVKQWLEETTQAFHLLQKKQNVPFVPISDIRPFLKHLEGNGVLSQKALLEIAQVLRLSATLKTYYAEDKESSFCESPLLEEYFSSLYSNPSIEGTISSAILDESTLADTASLELATIRKNLRKLEDSIKNKLYSFLHSSYSKYMQESLITIRNDRYVIPVKEEYRSIIKGFIHDISSSGSTVFIEPISIFELNNEMNSLKVAESIEIEKILAKLSSLLYPITQELQTTFEVIGKLDFIFAKALYAFSMEATLPTLSSNNLNLISARHPLIPKDVVVPITLSLGKDYSTLVITGPNTGGKTVTLKTVGLLTLMACSGLYIPVKETSCIPVFDQVFADIGDEQSIQESLSTFSSHMSNIISILNQVSKHSLILLDELGSGTDPLEGSSLAISILETLHQKGCFTLATTHYPEIKEYALITDGFENASCEFDLEHLCPTYHLLIGIPGKSNAFAISKRLGLDPTILERASSFLNPDAIHTEELLKAIYDDKLLIEKEKEITQKNSHQIETLRKSWEQKNNSLKEKEQSILEKAKQEARTILLNAKQEASDTLKEINRIQNSPNSHCVRELNQIRNELNDKVKSTTTTSSFPQLQPNSLTTSDIQLGMSVFVTTLNQSGTLLTLPNKSKQVQVQVGNAKLMLPLSVLVKGSSKKTTPTSTSTTSYAKGSKSKTATTEINVIGYNVEEAIFVLDKYLDDSTMAKLSTVRIVHGKGTGTLRKGIHDFLSKHPHVKSFRLGTFGEGESGVTIVELK